MNTPLTRSQFSIAIGQGRGKALMHAKQFGIENVTDLVLEACLNNPPLPILGTFEADWLFAFFKDTPQYESISDEFLSQITKTGGISNDDYFLCEQHCAITALIARQGNKRAEKILRDFVLNQPLDKHLDWCGIKDLHSLGIKEDAILIASRTGQSLRIHSEYQGYVDCLSLRDLYCYDKSFNQTLLELAQNDEDIKIYLEEFEIADKKADYFWKRSDSEVWRQSMREQYPLEKILAMAHECDDRDWIRMKVTRPWADHELRAIAKCILAEKNDLILCRLMSIFWVKPLPEFDPAFFRFTHSSNPDVRRSCLRLLSTIRDERVNNFGREMLEDIDYVRENTELFGIFNAHFKEGDEIKIISVLESLEATPELIYDLPLHPKPDYSQNSTSGLVHLLLWLYEHQPCPSGRGGIISELFYNLKAFTKEMAIECFYDVNRSTREKAQTWLEREKIPLSPAYGLRNSFNLKCFCPQAGG